MPRSTRAKPRERAKKGEGQHWEDKQGRHHYRITVKGERYEVADSDAERALAQFKELKEQLNHNLRVRDARQPFKQFLEWALNQPQMGGKESTRVDRQKRVNSCIAPVLGDTPIKNIDASTVSDWQNIVFAKFAYNSAKQARSLLIRILNMAIVEKLIEINPALSVPLPPKPVDETINESDEEYSDGIGRPMTTKHLERFLEAIRGHWYEPLYLLALGLGLRRGELLGLRWRDFRKDKGILWVKQAISEVQGNTKRTTPKNTPSRRLVPLLDEHIALLDAHLVVWWQRRDAAQKSGKWNGDEHDLIFCSEVGTPVIPRNLLRHYHQAQKRAEIPLEERYRFHDLRHTANQAMANAGMMAKLRAAILGQASVQLNENIYTHASAEARREALKQVKQIGR